MQPRRPRSARRGDRLRHQVGRLGLAAGAAWLILTVAGTSAPAAHAEDPSPSASPGTSPSASPATTGDASAPVYIVTATGVVDNVMAGYIEAAIDRAAEDA